MGDAANVRHLTRDQQRASHAYQRVGAVIEGERKDYKILVNDLGANILRLGLAVAIATVERDAGGKPEATKTQAAERLLNDLADAGVPGLPHQPGNPIGDQVRHLPLPAYLLASRELLKVAVWFKRAVQAVLPEEPDHA